MRHQKHTTIVVEEGREQVDPCAHAALPQHSLAGGLFQLATPSLPDCGQKGQRLQLECVQVEAAHQVGVPLLAQNCSLNGKSIQQPTLLVISIIEYCTALISTSLEGDIQT